MSHLQVLGCLVVLTNEMICFDACYLDTNHRLHHTAAKQPKHDISLSPYFSVERYLREKDALLQRDEQRSWSGCVSASIGHAQSVMERPVVC